MVLGWGELSDEDRPPLEIWLDPEELDSHFTNVKARWARGSSSSDSPEMEPINDEDSTANEYTRGLRERLKG